MDIKIGDLTTAYWKGFYEVVEITRRWKNKHKTSPYEQHAYCIQGKYDEANCGEEMNPLVHLVQKYSAEGKPMKSSKVMICDACFCKPADEFIKNEIQRLNEVIERLKKVK